MPDIDIDGNAVLPIKKDPADDDQDQNSLMAAEGWQKLMVAAKYLKLGQRLPTVKPPTTAAEDLARLGELTRQTHDNLMESKPLFPFIYNPSSITIDRQKLTVVHRSLLRVRQTVSVMVGDIINVQASMGPVFGSLTITSKHFLNNVQNIRNLPRKDVIRARRLLQGLMIACQAKVDVTKIEKTTLLQLLNDLGSENRVIR